MRDTGSQAFIYHGKVGVGTRVVSIGNVKVRYLIKNDMIYFHRMTIFESIGLERALILNSKGLPAINR